jgi:hypothetical protein
VFLPQCLNPFFSEALREVLDGVKSETLQTRLLNDPLSPICDVLTDLRVRVVQVGKHEEIGIAALVINSLTPTFTLALDLENRILSRGGVEVCTAKVVPVVLLLRVLVASAIKVEAQPCGNLMTVGNCLLAVVGVDFNDVALLFLVGSSFVVEDCVPVEANVVFFC